MRGSEFQFLKRTVTSYVGERHEKLMNLEGRLVLIGIFQPYID